MSEKVTFQVIRILYCAVDTDKTTLTPPAVKVNSSSDQEAAGTRLTLDENRGRIVREDTNLLKDVHNCIALSDDILESVDYFLRVPEVSHLLCQAPVTEGLFDPHL